MLKCCRENVRTKCQLTICDEDERKQADMQACNGAFLLPHRSAATRHSYSTYKTFKEHSVMGNWIGLPGHVQNSVIADVNIHSLQWLVGDSEMNKTILPSISMSKFVVMEDLPCMPVRRSIIPVGITFF